MIQINKINTWGCTLILLICASCGSSKHLPDIPKSNLPESFSYDTSTSFVDSTETVANLSYKEFFNDQHLISLIESGLQQNNNMQVAIKQIEIAKQTMKQAKWGYLPIINLSAASSSITRSSDNSLNGIMASQFTGKPYIEDYSSMIDMSWEADIWGKIKNQKAGALARYLESIEAVKAVRTNLVARIAQGYYNLLMLDEQKLVSTHNQAIVDSTLVMVKVQNRLGISNSLAVKQLENSRDNLSKYIRQIDENVTTQEYALKALVGDTQHNS